MRSCARRASHNQLLPYSKTHPAMTVIDQFIGDSRCVKSSHAIPIMSGVPQMDLCRRQRVVCSHEVYFTSHLVWSSLIELQRHPSFLNRHTHAGGCDAIQPHAIHIYSFKLCSARNSIFYHVSCSLATHLSYQRFFQCCLRIGVFALMRMRRLGALAEV
jgi:hypothetical protein